MPTLPTNAAFKAALEAMTVTGVTVHKGFPPLSVSTSDLPLAYISMQSAGLGEYVLSCTNEDKTRTMLYVILLEAVGQSAQETNYDLIAPIMDNLESALDSALGTLANFHTYDIESGIVNVAGGDFWAVTATVSIRSV